MQNFKQHPLSTILGIVIMLISIILFVHAFLNPSEYSLWHYLVLVVAFAIGINLLYSTDKFKDLASFGLYRLIEKFTKQDKD